MRAYRYKVYACMNKLFLCLCFVCHMLQTILKKNVIDIPVDDGEVDIDHAKTMKGFLAY